jgi:ankyrin repeat protein
MMAQYDGNVELTRLLVEHGAKVDAREQNGMTALTFAIAFGHEVTTGYLLEQGADPNLVLTEEGDTPLSFAVRFPELAQRDDLVRLVVEHGGDVTQAAGNGRSPFSELAGSGRAELVRWLMVEQGVGTGDSLPVPPLLRAAEEGEVAVVRLLLQHGADANAIDATGQSALFVAEVQGAGEISELLRSHGADDSGLRRATSPDGLLVPVRLRPPLGFLEATRCQAPWDLMSTAPWDLYVRTGSRRSGLLTTQGARVGCDTSRRSRPHQPALTEGELLWEGRT